MDKPEKSFGKAVQRFGVPKARDRVLEALSQAYVEQQLETDDYENRVEMAYKARTLEDLEDAVYDFPNRTQIIQRQKENPQVQRRQRPTPAVDNFSDTTSFALIGDRRVSEEDFVESSIQMIQGIGDFVVDLRDVSDNRTLELNHFSLIGDTKILVPKGMVVRKRNFISILGEFRRRRRRDLSKFLGKLMGQSRSEEEDFEIQPTNSTLTIKGGKLIGDITIIDH